MKVHLQSAHKRFKELIPNREFNINPINEIDCEIIVELIELLKKHNLTKLVSVLDQWKYLKDEEVRDLLIDLNIQTNSENYEEKEEKKKSSNEVKFISIKSNSLRVDLISTITTYEEFSFVSKRTEYYIVINKDIISKMKNIGLPDTYITFYTKEDRDNNLNLLIGLLENEGVKFLII